MQRAPLGRTGLTVSAIGLGCAGMTDPANPVSDEEAHGAMWAALEAGIDLFDTSDLYGVGENERLVGRFIAKAGRDRIMLATKFGSMPGGSDGMGSGARGVNNHPDYIPQACDASLKRLGTDVIDLYYMHRRDPAVPMADSVGAMARLIEAGKVRAIGLSEVSPTTLREAFAVHPIAALQSEYSLWMRDRETDVLPVCRELGISFVPFSPLGRAFLTGTLKPDTLDPRDFRASLPRFQGEAAEQNLQLVERLQTFAAARDATAAQIALAWLISKGRKGSAIVPIPGTRRSRYVSANAAAASIALSDADVSTLDTLFAPGAIVGERYTPDEEARAGL